MTVTRSYTIWCEGVDYAYDPEGRPCDEWHEESNIPSIQAMREYMKGDWTFVGGKDYCPACSFARGYREGPVPYSLQYHIERRIPPGQRTP